MQSIELSNPENGKSLVKKCKERTMNFIRKKIMQKLKKILVF